VTATTLTADQLEQLEALLADTTPGGGAYRPPVARDDNLLGALTYFGLATYTSDCGYEITDAGKAAVVNRAMDAADTEAFLRYASKYELAETIRRLKAVVPTLVEDEQRERTLQDIEACQDRLDELAATRACWAPGDQEHDHEMCNDVVAERAERSESTGRHRLVPVDDRPTEVLPAVVEQAEFEPSSGTLPGLPVVESDGTPCDPDEQATIRLIAAIRATPSPAELAEVAAAQEAGWEALEADLGDERGWWRRNLRPHRVLILSIVATVVVTWGVAWWVMG